jgi:predicted DNA-binding protein (MmcQ/YjbR family)
MTYDEARRYLLRKPEALEDFPFGPKPAVFKIRGKMFGLLSESEGSARLNLKCDPEEAMFLRDMFDAVVPGYHMNKAHWNTVILDGSIPRGEVERMIDRSFALVVKSLKKADRLALELRYGKDLIYAGAPVMTRPPRG